MVAKEPAAVNFPALPGILSTRVTGAQPETTQHNGGRYA
jgi:hypothetical protein